MVWRVYCDRSLLLEHATVEKVARRDWERALRGQMGKGGDCKEYKSSVNCQGLGTEYKI